MNDTGKESEQLFSAPPTDVLYLLAALNIVVLGIGLFVGSNADDSHTGFWRVALVLGDLAAIVSISTVSLSLGKLTLGTQITFMFVLVMFVWLAIGLLFENVIGRPDNAMAAVMEPALVTTVFVTQGLLTILASMWLRGTFSWVLLRSAPYGYAVDATARRQFRLSHILLWMFMAGVTLAILRAMTRNVWPDARGFSVTHLFVPLLFCAVFGAIHTVVGLVTVTLVGLRPRSWSLMLAVSMAAIIAILSVGLGVVGYWNDIEIWPLPLNTVVHFVLLSASICLMRTAGYEFTNGTDTPAEATPP